MKFNILTLILFSIMFISTSCEKETTGNSYTETFQPSGSNGVDAFVLDSKPGNNYGTHSDFAAIGATNSGATVIVRSLMKFDLDAIPENAEIESIKLSLFAYDSPSNGRHRNDGGSNACVLQKINSDWDEQTVTWNNQPTTSSVSQVTLAASLSNDQHYENIDVTDLFTDMIKNRDSNYGFMIKLEAEGIYRSLIFASSDNENSSIHPKLEVKYSIEE